MLLLKKKVYIYVLIILILSFKTYNIKIYSVLEKTHKKLIAKSLEKLMYVEMFF